MKLQPTAPQNKPAWRMIVSAVPMASRSGQRHRPPLPPHITQRRTAKVFLAKMRRRRP